MFSKPGESAFSHKKARRYDQKLGDHRNLLREEIYLIKCCAWQVVYDKNDHGKSFQTNYYWLLLLRKHK